MSKTFWWWTLSLNSKVSKSWLTYPRSGHLLYESLAVFTELKSSFPVHLSDCLSVSQRLLRAVSINAVRGDPDSVIAAIDHFCKHSEWAMNVGDEKGTHMQSYTVIRVCVAIYSHESRALHLPGAILDSVVMETSPSTVLELGTYCGYSSVRITRLLPPATKLITVEMNPDYAHVARQVIQHAGLQNKVRGLGGRQNIIRGQNMQQAQGLGCLQAVCWKGWWA